MQDPRLQMQRLGADEEGADRGSPKADRGAEEAPLKSRKNSWKSPKPGMAKGSKGIRCRKQYRR